MKLIQINNYGGSDVIVISDDVSAHTCLDNSNSIINSGNPESPR